SGVLGHYFTAHVRDGGGNGDMPVLGAQPSLGGPHRPTGIYVARFRNLKNGPQSKNFVRGYGYEGGADVDFNWSAPGFGESFKQALKEPRVNASVLGFGEVLPRFDNFVEIDHNVKDKFGIPVLRIHMSRSANEEAMVKDMAESAG